MAINKYMENINRPLSNLDQDIESFSVARATYKIYRNHSFMPSYAKCYSCHSKGEELLLWSAKVWREPIEIYTCWECLDCYTNQLNKGWDIGQELKEESDFTRQHLKFLRPLRCPTCHKFYVGMVGDKGCTTCQL